MDPRRPRSRILLVEDDPDIRTAIVDTVVAAGHQVDTASDGREGLAAMHASRPDLVLLDLMMPNMDGWQFRVEQRRDPLLAATPVIALSASTSAAAAAIDAERYLPKPIAAEQLLAAIDETLRAHTDRQERAHLLRQERMAALGTLAAGIAHEISNPLTYVLLHLTRVERLLAALPEPLVEVERSLAHVGEGTERIRQLIAAVRTFSRVDDIGRYPIELGPVVTAALTLVWPQLYARAQLHVEHRDPPMVCVNEGRLGQVLVNLLTNAVEAIPEGAPATNRIDVIVGSDSAGRALIEISDTGRGIPERLLDRIFEPFFSTHPVGQGSGLGLSICHGIVTSLDGELSVESQPGRGSTFRVSLPPAAHTLRQVHGTPRATPAARSRGAAAAARPLRLLVIDDDPAVRLAIDAVLRGEHRVSTVGSGAEALELLDRDDAFDALLCELHLPGMSGVELYARLSERHRALAKRTLFMTRGAFTQTAKSFLAEVGDRVVDKPLDLARLKWLLGDVSRTARGKA